MKHKRQTRRRKRAGEMVLTRGFIAVRKGLTKAALKRVVIVLSFFSSAGVNKQLRCLVLQFLELPSDHERTILLKRPTTTVKTNDVNLLERSPRQQYLREKRVRQDRVTLEDGLDVLESPVVGCFTVRFPLANGKLLVEGTCTPFQPPLHPPRTIIATLYSSCDKQPPPLTG